MDLLLLSRLGSKIKIRCVNINRRSAFTLRGAHGHTAKTANNVCMYYCTFQDGNPRGADWAVQRAIHPRLAAAEAAPDSGHRRGAGADQPLHRSAGGRADTVPDFPLSSGRPAQPIEMTHDMSISAVWCLPFSVAFCGWISLGPDLKWKVFAAHDANTAGYKRSERFTTLCAVRRTPQFCCSCSNTHKVTCRKYLKELPLQVVSAPGCKKRGAPFEALARFHSHDADLSKACRV